MWLQKGEDGGPVLGNKDLKQESLEKQTVSLLHNKLHHRKVSFSTKFKDVAKPVALMRGHAAAQGLSFLSEGKGNKMSPKSKSCLNKLCFRELHACGVWLMFRMPQYRTGNRHAVHRESLPRKKVDGINQRIKDFGLGRSAAAAMSPEGPLPLRP